MFGKDFRGKVLVSLGLLLLLLDVCRLCHLGELREGRTKTRQGVRDVHEVRSGPLRIEGLDHRPLHNRGGLKARG